jgi:hypothetical protein
MHGGSGTFAHSLFEYWSSNTPHGTINHLVSLLFWKSGRKSLSSRNNFIWRKTTSTLHSSEILMIKAWVNHFPSNQGQNRHSLPEILTWAGNNSFNGDRRDLSKTNHCLISSEYSKCFRMPAHPRLRVRNMIVLIAFCGSNGRGLIHVFLRKAKDDALQTEGPVLLLLI